VINEEINPVQKLNFIFLLRAKVKVHLISLSKAKSKEEANPT